MTKEKKKDENVDVVSGGKAFGEVANFAANAGRLDPGSMRPYIGRDGKPYMTVFKGGDPKKPQNYKAVLTNNATLRKDEWKQLDEVLLPIAESRLNGIQDLIGRGLTHNLGNAMGTMVLDWHDVSDAMEADLTMDGVSRSKGDRPTYGTGSIPIPIIHVDYEINLRVLEASRRMGNPLDTTSAERAARRVAEKLERMLFTDTDYEYGSGKIESYVNFEHRNQFSLFASWTASPYDPEAIRDDVLDMKQMSIDAHHYGPWVLYIPTAYETLMDNDYDTSGQSTQTLRERLMKIGGIEDIKVVDELPGDNVVLAQMSSDNVRLIRGMGIQNVSWETEGRFISKYKVMTIQVPQLRADQNGNCGIVHGTV